MLSAVLEIGDNLKAVLVLALGGVGSAGGWAAYARSRKDGKAVVTELQPNGGSSLRDVADRIEKSVAALAERVTAIEEVVTRP